MIGGYGLNWSSLENRAFMKVDGVSCAKGASYTNIDTNAFDTMTFAQWSLATGRLYSFFGYYVNSANQVYVSTQGAANRLVAAVPSSQRTANYTYNTWVCICATLDNVNHQYKIYANGVLLSQTITTNTNIGYTRWSNGSIASPDSFGDYALVSSFRVYNRLLSQDEITLLAHEFTTP